jgi:hypothetical protein
MNKTLLIDVASSIFWTFIIICIMTLVAACSNEIEQTKPIVIEHINGSYSTSTIIIKDTRRNLQWDAFQSGHAIIIIPGTEKPIKNVEYTP